MSDNETIAEFMGWTQPAKMGYWYPPKLKESEPDIPHAIEHLKFNYSWDWLMPVVEKIGSMEIVSIELGSSLVRDDGQIEKLFFCNIEDWKDNEIAYEQDKATLIEAVYPVIVNFIKWYNSNVTP